MNERDAVELLERCSNLGRWGADDELGTVNYITASERLRALSLVTEGVVIGLARPMRPRVASMDRSDYVVHRMLSQLHDDAISCSDSVEIAPHGFGITHLDALGHVFLDGEVYNGRLAAEVVTLAGLVHASITAFRDGIVTRGVLLDVARSRNVDWLEPGDGITVRDLEDAESQGDVRVSRGDAIFVRSGLQASEAAGLHAPDGVRTGIEAECVEWFHDRQIAVYSGDCIERLPSRHPRLPLPLHQIGLARMGLAVLDNPDVELLWRACAVRSRVTFLLAIAPLPVAGSTGSPVNPLAVF